MKILFAMAFFCIQDTGKLSETGKEITAELLKGHVTELAGEA